MIGGDRMRELEDRAMNMQKGKTMKKKEGSLRDLWDLIKGTNIRT